MGKRTLVLGASAHSYRYSFLAIEKLLANGHEVVALGGKPGWVGQVQIYTSPANWGAIDTVTIYLSPLHQKGYYQYLQILKPNRVIFNPGAENGELRVLLEKEGIITLNACTLVLLSTGQY